MKIVKGGKYTAAEILEAAGLTDPRAIFGTDSVIIGGISGIRNPDHLIKVAGDELLVLIGDVSHEVEVTEPSKKEENAGVISDGARKAFDEKGKRIRVQNEVHRERKKLVFERDRLNSQRKFEKAAEVTEQIEKLGRPLAKTRVAR